jgi:hypothetical protein
MHELNRGFALITGQARVHQNRMHDFRSNEPLEESVESLVATRNNRIEEISFRNYALYKGRARSDNVLRKPFQ